MNVDDAVAEASCDIRSAREPLFLLLLVGMALVVSDFHPYDRVTWILEVFPVLLGASILVATRLRSTRMPLLYRLLFPHALILMLAGRCACARVPLGSSVQDLLGLARSHFDRLEHLAQAFVASILTRDVLIRRMPLRPDGASSSSPQTAFPSMKLRVRPVVLVICGSATVPVSGLTRRPGRDGAGRFPAYE